MAPTDTLCKKAIKHLQRGETVLAEKQCLKILRSNPSHIEARHLLGMTYMRRSLHEQAIGVFHEVIAANPRDPRYHYHLAYSMFRTGRLPLALRSFHEAIHLKRDFGEAYSYLALVLADLGELKKALTHARTAVSINPHSPEILTNMALVLEKWGDYTEALEYYASACQRQPENPVYHANLGNAYLGQGNIVAASQCYRRAIALAPGYGEPYLSLVRIGGLTAEDSHLVRQLHALSDSSRTTDEHRIAALYALGIINDKSGNFQDAFDYYSRANAMEESHYPFSMEAFVAYLEQVKAAFNSQFIDLHRGRHRTAVTPVFIVGMPRSGTSLIHQILASHPDVHGAGELPWFSNIHRNLQRLLQTEALFPECLSRLDEKNVIAIANDYFEHIPAMGGGKRFIVDKLPVNFLYLGLITILFPDARIIHCHRDPRDTCLSIYFNRFPGSISYSNNLSTIGAYYRQYEQVMRHWEKVLPEPVHELRYETLVESTEETARMAVNYLGLEWDHACLSFDKTKTSMRTASDHQVRKPVYKSSVSRWRNYAPYLQELNRSLQESEHYDSP